MKLLYIFLDETKSPGVIKKVKDKIKYLSTFGLEVEGIFLNPLITEYKHNKEEKIFYIPQYTKKLKKIYYRRYIRNYIDYFHFKNNYIAKYAALEKVVKAKTFDFIIFRYPLANKQLLEFVKKYPNKIIFEHNSKELVELALNSQNKYYINNEKKYGHKVLSLAKGITGVGNEIVHYELSRSQKKMPYKVIPNGIDVTSVPMRIDNHFKGEVLKLVYVTGSPSPWVGIDILIKSFERYSGNQKVTIQIIGPISRELELLVNSSGVKSSIELVGEKFGLELNTFFDSNHIAIGTLAMHRVGLSEHSSLKVCEYAARGIPFVLGYDDTNFYQSKTFQPYFKKVTLKNDVFDFEEVIDFAKTFISQENVAKNMRSTALGEIDFSIQMKKLTDFVSNL